MKQAQVVTSISLGMGKVGKERLAQYKEKAKRRGYESLSALIIHLADKDLGVNLPKPRTRVRLRST